MIKEFIADNIVSSAIDGIVDDSVNSLLGKGGPTYIWTAVAKQVNGINLLAVEFINDAGQYRLVNVNEIDNFCNNNYVSNLDMKDGKPELRGNMSMSDLTYCDLGSSDPNRLRGSHDKQWALQNSSTFIEMTKQQIYNDKHYGNVKGSSGEVKTNITENISNIQKISTAVGVTALATAGTAVVAGTGMAAKAIYNQLNKKNVVKMQYSICKNLYSYEGLIEVLIKTKYKTNSFLRSNPSITEYTNIMESQQDDSGKLSNEIRKYGINGCIQKLSGLIEQCRTKADSNKIIDYPLNISIIHAGSINAYISSLNSKIEQVKQLHNTTMQMINKNRQAEEAEEQAYRQAIEEQRHAREVQQEIRETLAFISERVDRADAVDTSLDFSKLGEILYNDVNGVFTGLRDLINKVYRLLDELTDIQLRDAFNTKLNLYRERVNRVKRIYDDKLSESFELSRDQLEIDIERHRLTIEELIQGKYTTSESTRVLADLRTGLSSCRDMAVALEGQTVIRFNAGRVDIIDGLVKRLDDNERKIRESMEKADRDETKIASIIQRVDDARSKIEMLNTSEIKLGYNMISQQIFDKINSLKTSLDYDFRNINNIEKQQAQRQWFNTQINEIMNIYNERLDKEKEFKEQGIQEMNNMINKINALKTKVNGLGETEDVLAESFRLFEECKQEYDEIKCNKEYVYSKLKNEDESKLRQVLKTFDDDYMKKYWALRKADKKNLYH